MSPSKPSQNAKPAGGSGWEDAQRAVRERNDEARRAGKKERDDKERRAEANQRKRDQQHGVDR